MTTPRIASCRTCERTLPLMPCGLCATCSAIEPLSDAWREPQPARADDAEVEL